MQGARDGNALFLASAEFIRPERELVLQAHGLEQLPGSPFLRMTPKCPATCTFSNAVKERIRRNAWNTNPIFSRRSVVRSLSLSAFTFLPSM